MSITKPSKSKFRLTKKVEGRPRSKGNVPGNWNPHVTKKPPGGVTKSRPFFLPLPRSRPFFLEFSLPAKKPPNLFLSQFNGPPPSTNHPQGFVKGKSKGILPGIGPLGFFCSPSESQGKQHQRMNHKSRPPNRKIRGLFFGFVA